MRSILFPVHKKPIPRSGCLSATFFSSSCLSLSPQSVSQSVNWSLPQYRQDQTRCSVENVCVFCFFFPLSPHPPPLFNSQIIQGTSSQVGLQGPLSSACISQRSPSDGSKTNGFFPWIRDVASEGLWCWNCVSCRGGLKDFPVSSPPPCYNDFQLHQFHPHR